MGARKLAVARGGVRSATYRRVVLEPMTGGMETATNPASMRAPEPHEKSWTPQRLAWWQARAIAILAVLSLAEQAVIHLLGREDLEDFLITFDLDAEANLPTWYASISLLACAVVLGRIAVLTRRQERRFVGHWRALAAIFVFLSLDEIARLHEHLGRLQGVWHTHGLFYFAWVVPAGLAVAVGGALFMRFLLHLPRATRWRFVGAGIVFLTGALVVEALGGWRAETMGMNNMTHSWIATLEEVLELAGVAWFLVALLRHLQDLARGPGAATPADVEPGPAARERGSRRAA